MMTNKDKIRREIEAYEDKAEFAFRNYCDAHKGENISHAIAMAKGERERVDLGTHPLLSLTDLGAIAGALREMIEVKGQQSATERNPSLSSMWSALSVVEESIHSLLSPHAQRGIKAYHKAFTGHEGPVDQIPYNEELTESCIVDINHEGSDDGAWVMCWHWIDRANTNLGVDYMPEHAREEAIQRKKRKLEQTND